MRRFFVFVHVHVHVLVLVLVLFSYVDCDSTSRASDVAAMQELKRSLKPPSSLGWNDPDPCKWNSVTVTCSKENRVTNIKLGGKLSGGSLPQSLSNLTLLEVFEVQGNQLSGPLPSLHELNSLRRILINNNSFTSIPLDFFSGMSALQEVYLDHNPFSAWGLFDSLKDCSSLRMFSANSANINGRIPDFLNSGKFPSLEHLHLAMNSLEGELPGSFVGSSFQTLWLNGQNLNGNLSVLQNMTQLKQVWLNGNNFSGPLPDFSGFIQLEDFNVRENRLTGIVPDSLVKLSTLKNVTLTNNLLQGKTPIFDKYVTVDMIPNTNSFCLDDPGLQCDDRVNLLLDVAKGTGYPIAFAENWKGNDPCKGWRGISCNNKGNITVVNLQNMGLSGMVLQVFTQIPTLESLNLASNSLMGPIPDELTRLANLKLLDVSNNMICGEVPTFNSNVKVKIGGNVNLGKKCPITLSGGLEANSQTGGSKTSSGVIVGVVGGIVGLILFAGLVAYFIYKTKHRRSSKVQGHTTLLHHRPSSDQEAVKLRIGGSNKNGQTSESHSLGSGPSDMNLGGSSNMVISIQILRTVTNNFNMKNILGKGGFGTVYKGVLHDGKEIAVKRMKSGVMGENGMDEFTSEIAVLTKVRHRHLVSLLGYCLDGNERLLVYEYMSQGTLSQHLFNWKEEGFKPLEWTNRLIIALDVARAVEYLHSLAQQSFIHRDLKSSNILLSDDMRAKVADFGLVRLVPDGKASLATKLAGTFGYLAPEYAESGRVTTKVDVYSFGVILMEMITGRKALDGTQPEECAHLVPWFRRMLLNKDDLHKAIDPSIGLHDSTTLTSIITVAELAKHCSSREPYQRPDMSHVVNVLSSLAELWEPSELEQGENGVVCETSLAEAVKKWQALEGMTGIDSSASYLANAEHTGSSIPSKPSGFADSFSTTTGR